MELARITPDCGRNGIEIAVDQVMAKRVASTGYNVDSLSSIFTGLDLTPCIIDQAAFIYLIMPDGIVAS